jgi:hypothetical protein
MSRDDPFANPLSLTQLLGNCMSIFLLSLALRNPLSIGKVHSEGDREYRGPIE